MSRMLARATAALAAVLVSLVALAAAASAHVSVSSADAAPGGFGKLTFRVPNESDTASTVGLRIQIPEEAALASLRTQPVPGWTATLTTENLDEPLDNHGQEITSYVSVVEFRAEQGGGIGPGQFQEFALSGGPFPDVETIAYPTVQLYSDGTESAWIEPTVDGQSEPERPAPVLTLTAADAPTTGSSTAEETSADHSHTEAAADDPGAVALFVAILALLVGIGGVVLGWRAGRRTVSS